jgi:hypothetical protein
MKRRRRERQHSKAEADLDRRRNRVAPISASSSPPGGSRALLRRRVLRYLARYNHRAAISNVRLVRLEDDR